MKLDRLGYARKMAGNWEKMAGFMFFWEDLVETRERALDLTYLVLYNETLGLAEESNALHICEVLELEFPDIVKIEKPNHWTGVGMIAAILPVYGEDPIKEGAPYHDRRNPLTRRIHPAFNRLYDLLSEANMFVNDLDVEILNTKLYRKLKKNADFHGIDSVAFENGITLTPEEIALVYDFLKPKKQLKSVDGRGAYPSKKQIKLAVKTIRGDAE